MPKSADTPDQLRAAPSYTEAELEDWETGDYGHTVTDYYGARGLGLGVGTGSDMPTARGRH